MMKILRIALSLCVLLTTISLCGCQKGGITIYDADNGKIATVNSFPLKSEALEKEGYRAFVEIALEEATTKVKEIEKCEAKEAIELMISKGYSVYTNFDKETYSAVENAFSLYKNVSNEAACAVTDLNGGLIAVFSKSEMGQNNAVAKRSPYSSIKPLSVYAPAIEKNKITCSTVTEDSPYKQIENNGVKTDWPNNADGNYSYSGCDLQTAVSRSLNTVAVKTLARVGVNESIEFLEENFSFKLDFEKNKANALGEEEVIGNIAMGYLQNGVSAVDMAGYYQAFANGGMYKAPTAVRSISCGGREVYKETDVGKRAIESDTAYIMNQLLRTVVQKGATGEDAYCENIAIGGKTGTGVSADGNWFVGFTPQMSCAVWHGSGSLKNSSPAIFGAVALDITKGNQTAYPPCDTVYKTVYCVDSGGKRTSGCKKISVGYFRADTVLPECDLH